MKKTSMSASLLICLVWAIPAMAQVQEKVTLNSTQVKRIKSAYVKDMEYKLDIILPPDYSSFPEKKYPVLFYLDAYMGTGVLNDSYFGLYLTKQVIPVILVGISFDGNTGNFIYNRARDYTPTYVSPDSLGESGRMVPTSGGAPAFLQSIKNELIPFMDSMYRIDKKDLGILGYSLGGLFAAWVLSKESGLFKRYGICSPSLYWDKSTVLNSLEDINIKEEKIIFISRAEFEQQNIVTVFQKISGIFEKNKLIQLNSAQFPGENHFSGFPAAYVRALAKLYGNR